MAGGFNIGKGIASTAASAWLRQISALILYMIAARMLSPDDIGLFALVAAIVLLFEYAVFDSIAEAIVQRVDLTESHVGAATALSAVFAALIAGGGWLASGWLARIFSEPGLTWILPVMAGGVAIICLSAVHFGILRREARFHTMALMAGGAGALSVMIGAALIFAGAGITGMVVYFVSEKLILCLATIWLARAQPLARFAVGHVADLGPYAAAISGQRLAYYARNQMDRVIIGAIWGTGVLGAYQLAARSFDSLQAALLMPPSKLFFVSFTKLQNHPAQLREMFTHSLRAVSLFGFPAFLGISAVAPEAIALLFGATNESSAIILEVLGFGGLALVLSTMCGAVLSSLGRAREFLLVEVGSTVAGLLLLLVLSRFGLAWIAAAFVLRETLAVLLYARLLGPRLNLRPRDFIACFAPCLASGIVMWMVVRSLDLAIFATLPLIPTLALKVAVGGIVYLAMMLLLGRGLMTETIRLLSGTGPLPRAEEA